MVTYDDRCRDVFRVGDEFINGSLVRGSFNSLKLTGSPAGGSGWTPYSGNLEVQNTSSSANNLLSGKNSAGVERVSITGYGQGRFGFEGGTPASSDGACQFKGPNVSGYPNSQGRFTTNVAASSSASVFYVTADGYRFVDNTVTVVRAVVIGRALDDSKAIHKEITGLIHRDGSASSVVDYTELASHAHGGDTSTVTLNVTGYYPRVAITPDSAADRTWVVYWFIGSLGAAS